MHLRSASEKKKQIATIITFFAIPLSGFMTDIYLPSFPSMARNLNVSESAVQLTLTSFFLSYGVAQLVVGSLLDTLGRYKPVLVSLAVLTLSSVAIAFTENIGLICLWRIVQGIATSFIVVAKRAYFVDVYDGDKRDYFLSYFTIIWSCGPIIAPFLGGYLESIFHWQSNFYFLAGYSGLLLVAEALFSGETVRLKQPFKPKKMLILYRIMLRNKPFVLGIFILGLAYSTVMVFNIAGPFVVEEHFHFSSVTTGYCTLILGIGWMLGGVLTKQLHEISFGTKIKQITGLLIGLTILFAATGFSIDSLYLLVAGAFFIHLFSGFIFTNYFTKNMIYFPNNAGLAGGLIGGLLYIITSLSSFFISASGSVKTTFGMSVRYVFILVPLAAVVFYSLRMFQKHTVSRG